MAMGRQAEQRERVSPRVAGRGHCGESGGNWQRGDSPIYLRAKFVGATHISMSMFWLLNTVSGWVGSLMGKRWVTVEGRGVEAQARRVGAGGRSVMGRKVSKTGRWTSGPPWGPHVMRQPICHTPSARTPYFCKGTLQSWCIHPAASASTAGNEQTMSCHGIHSVHEAIILAIDIVFDRRWIIGAIPGEEQSRHRRFNRRPRAGHA